MLSFNRFRLPVLMICVLAFACLAAAQSTVAVVDTQRAILGTAEIQQAQLEMEADFKPRQDELETLNRELQDIQGQLQKMAGKLTPQAELDLQLQGQRKQRDAQRRTEDLQADVDARRNDTLQKSGAQMSAVIQKLAEEKGIDVVVDVANTLYFKPTLDLTAEALAAYDAAYPVQ